jgi:hypothetical protein
VIIYKTRWFDRWARKQDLDDLEKETLENKLIEVNCNAEEEIADS